MSDTFNSIIVGECLPSASRTVEKDRAFEDGYKDSESLFKALGYDRRSHLTRRGNIWPKNLWNEPGEFVNNLDEAIIKWQNEISGEPNCGLYRATKRDINILATSNYVGMCLAKAHGFTAIAKVGEPPSLWKTPTGKTWRFLVWYRTDIRAGKNVGLAQQFLKGC